LRLRLDIPSSSTTFAEVKSSSGLRGEPTTYSYESHKIFTGGLRIESTAS
jgi:hypothetical protein